MTAPKGAMAIDWSSDNVMESVGPAATPVAMPKNIDTKANAVQFIFFISEFRFGYFMYVLQDYAQRLFSRDSSTHILRGQFQCIYLFFIAGILFSNKGQPSTIVILKGKPFGKRVWHDINSCRLRQNND